MLVTSLVSGAWWNVEQPSRDLRATPTTNNWLAHQISMEKDRTMQACVTGTIRRSVQKITNHDACSVLLKAERMCAQPRDTESNSPRLPEAFSNSEAAQSASCVLMQGVGYRCPRSELMGASLLQPATAWTRARGGCVPLLLTNDIAYRKALSERLFYAVYYGFLDDWNTRRSAKGDVLDCVPTRLPCVVCLCGPKW